MSCPSRSSSWFIRRELWFLAKNDLHVMSVSEILNKRWSAALNGQKDKCQRGPWVKFELPSHLLHMHTQTIVSLLELDGLPSVRRRNNFPPYSFNITRQRSRVCKAVPTQISVLRGSYMQRWKEAIIPLLVNYTGILSTLPTLSICYFPVTEEI